VDDVALRLAALLATVASLLASGHVILHKRDVRAALGWVGFIWFAPGVGALLYVLLGVNRIRRRAAKLGTRPLRFRVPDTARESRPPLPAEAAHLATLATLGDGVVRRPLVAGNRVALLPGGAAAYPAMLAAIDGAAASVTLCTYIFDRGAVGDAFVEALDRAHRRGVKVRVLVDAVGARYSWPPVHRGLAARGVPTALFLPGLTRGYIPSVNLRNHRKILVVDGRIGFTGGMNVRDDFVDGPSRKAFDDLHVRVEGPIVGQLQGTFAEDWQFSTGEELEGPAFSPPLGRAGGVVCRGVPDGPDEDFETLRLLLLGALASARRSIRIATPYFLPDAALVSALDVAALRGVEVDVVLPAETNHLVVQWAQTALLWQVLSRGCRVWHAPAPFDHSKLMVVDGAWTLLGSANWDPRSLRLNFELCVECWDGALGAEVEALFQARIARARPVTLADVDGRALPVKLRDGVARLFSPYL
jgi:cardiolipin synthase